MFDRYLTSKYTGPSKIDVHEHRAPTDDSIRLAEEMRNKLMKGILHKIPVEFNELLATAVVYRDPNEFYEEVIGIKFSINGVERIWKYHPRRFTSFDEKVDEMREEFSKFLAASLLGDFRLPLQVLKALTK